MKILLAIATGGALGAVLRYMIAQQVAQILGSDFPWATLIVNVFGSLLLGGFVGTLVASWAPNELMRGFVAVGTLGAFTTFSTFSMEIVFLYERGEWGLACLYLLASIVLSLTGFIVGLRIVRAVLV